MTMKQKKQFSTILGYLDVDTHSLPEAVLALEINQLRTDSRDITKNDLFIALKGHQSDGNDYLKEAIDNGAIAILSDSNDPSKDKSIHYITSSDRKKIPVVSFFQLSTKLSGLADHFYQKPSKDLTLVGVTGTNGKTTVTQLLAQLATLSGHKAGIIGTIGNGIYEHLSPAENTTPTAVALQSQLALFVQEHVDFVALEVSSHGLIEKRVADLNFDAVVFTNLSRDHLDFHGSMANYAAAKRSLFDKERLAVGERGIAIINFDDSTGREWLSTFDQVVAFSIDRQNLPKLLKFKKYAGVEKVTYHPGGTTIVLQTSWGDVTLISPLMGEFNVANLVAALATLLSLNYSFPLLAKAVPKLRPVPGRMERFSAEGKPEVIVDYAHTPDALIKALLAVRQHCKGKLWVIFGCGGERDRGKRPMMAKASEQYADHIILTQDNPRDEDESQIIDDIMQGFSSNIILFIERDREKAIHQAISSADVADTILVAGKGHETYQIIGRKKHTYSDRNTVANLLGITL